MTCRGGDKELHVNHTLNILSGFGMEAEQSGHMADVLALAASSANTDVHQLGEAMKYLAPSANALGWGVEESTAAIMAFSDAGIQGSMAGQAFSSSLQRLANPTNTMQSSIDELNISFFDAQGVMKPLPTIVGDLEKSMKGMTEEQKAMHLQQLFGAEAFKHWAVLLEQGGDKLAENTKMLEESKGAASEMAKEMNDNVLGKWKEFMSAMQELALVLFDTVQPALKAMIVFATKVASGFGALPGPIKAVLGVLAALVAVIGPIVLIIGKFASAIGAIMTLLAPFGGALTALGAVFAALTGPIGLTIAAIGALGAGIYGIVKLWKKHKGESKKANEEVAKDVDDATKKIADSYEERAVKAEQTMEQAYLQNRKLNDKEKNLLVSTQKEMTKATQEEIKKRADSEKKLAEEQLKNIDGLTDERKKAVMKGIEEEYAEVGKTVEAKEKEINEIYARATEEKRALKMTEKDRILELQNDMRETAIQMMTDSEKEQIALMEASAHQRNELTVKQTQEQVQKAIQKREKVTEEAEKEFEEVVQWAVRQADELGLISEEEKQKIIEQAAEKRDAKINQANETHEQVMARTREHSAEALAQIDEETGERLSKWDIFKRDFVAKIEEITVDTVEAWAWLWKRTKEKWDGMMDDLKSTFGAMKDNVKERWENIKQDTNQKWEDIKKSVNDRVDSMKKNSAAKWNAMWSDAKDKFERIKNSITEPMKKARDVVKGVIDDIKGFFKNLDLKFPEIKLPKLPKFKMDGKFSLNPPSVPKIGVDWFAKGGIMDKPTLFGVNGNRLMGGGEAGPEAIIPLRDDVLAKIGKSIVDSIGGIKEEASAANITVEHMTVRDESDILKISRELKRLMDRDRRARGGY